MAALRYFSRKLLNNTIKQSAKVQLNNINALQNRFATTFQYDSSKDPAPVFFNKQIQELLHTLTRVDLGKVYRKRKMGSKRLEQPVYKFMTEEQLKVAYKEAEEAVKDLLQMPPVVKPRESIDCVLSKDPALQGLETSKIIFTDITFGISNADRLIVVREPDGTLRKADWDLRDRMNQVYFTLLGRELRMPKMFEESRLKSLLDRQEYEFVLDRACTQFEPNDVEYHRVTQTTYLHVNEHNAFKLLRSTRHFGPLSFYLGWFKLIDNLLIELLESGIIEEADCLVKLYAGIHNCDIQGENVSLVESYVKEHSIKRGPLELALQTYKEYEKERKELRDGLKAAHGQH